MEQAVKVYVPVLAAFRDDGIMLPLRLRLEDGKVYSIDRVIGIR
ncbi:hypothetical protein [uncultured Oscillibacter sp.]|nr:hypothetical protein [uncultured Oscillibacter sp.]